jgi:hypothetical protein
VRGEVKLWLAFIAFWTGSLVWTAVYRPERLNLAFVAVGFSVALGVVSTVAVRLDEEPKMPTLEWLDEDDDDEEVS